MAVAIKSLQCSSWFETEKDKLSTFVAPNAIALSISMPTFSIDFEEVTTVNATYTGEGVEGNVLTLGSAEEADGAVSSTVTVALGGTITEAQAGNFTLTVAIAAAVVVE